MCSNSQNLSGALLPYGIKIPTPGTAYATLPAAGMAAFEQYRAQLYDYSSRLRYAVPYASHHGLNPYHPHPQDALAYLYGKHDPRARFLHEEPKPQHSYIGLISMAILSHKDKKLVLSDIYQWILDNYSYFRSRGPGWRNSIRHNLSLNDCFIKSGRSANGKGHYWAIHPANLEDFQKGDFRRRRAQRKVRKAMGMAVPDDDEDDSPPPRAAPVVSLDWQNKAQQQLNTSSSDETSKGDKFSDSSIQETPSSAESIDTSVRPARICTTSRKRLFDVESLLAPDDKPPSPKVRLIASNQNTGPQYLPQDVELIKQQTPIDFSKNINDTKQPISDDNCQESHANTKKQDSNQCAENRERSLSENNNLDSPGLSVLNVRDDTDVNSRTASPESISPQSGDVPVAWISSVPFRGWQDRPSAFHSTLPATVTAWSTLQPHGYSLMNNAYQLPHPGMMNSTESARKWRETMTRIMARSYDKNLKLQS